MVEYSKSSAELPHEKVDFERRLDSFFSGEPLPPADTGEVNLGASTEELQRRAEAELDAALALLDDDADDKPHVARFIAAYDGDDPPHRIYDAPDPTCRYGRAFARVRALEAQLEDASCDDCPRIEAELKAANAAWDVEKGRALDDRFRGFHRIDSWRANEGRDDYNASRRTKRDQSNASLKEMTPEERAAHRRAQKADSEWKRAKNAAGWTEQEIEIGLKRRRDKRAKASGA